MHIAILGRQPVFGVAELEQLYGAEAVRWFSDTTATVNSDRFDFNRLGGAQKAGRIIAELSGDWRRVSMQIVKHYSVAWAGHEGKITLGISAYNFSATPREIQKTGLVLKSKLKERGVSLRLVPNAEPALNTATSHHNKLGLSDNHVELLVVRSSGGKVIIAESIGAQNITALASRDQARPKTDSFVGMLPPKLARIMVNLTGLYSGRILDPFCGTGVLLQEAALLGFDIYGSDLSEKMVNYSKENLEWIRHRYNLDVSMKVQLGDAMEAAWEPPVEAISTETYLGQPFSAPPSPAKLTEVRGNCNHIISRFLINIGAQIAPGTPLCIAVPAWRSTDGTLTHLPLTSDVESLGFVHKPLQHVREGQLVYYRENQVVAREILLLKKA